MESGIHGCGIRNPQTWNPESTAWNPESRTLLDYLTWGDTTVGFGDYIPHKIPLQSIKLINTSEMT